MTNIIKKIVLVVSMLFLFAPLVLADVIHLKDGSVLRGKITEETTETITIEGEAYWTTVKRIDVQKIVREIEKPKEEKVTVIFSSPPRYESFIGINYLQKNRGGLVRNNLAPPSILGGGGTRW